MSRRPRPWPWGLVEKNGVKRFFAIAIRIPDVRRLPIAFPQDTESSRMGGSRVLTSYCKRVFRVFLVPCKSTTYASRLLKRHKRETKCTEIVPLLFLGYKGTNFPRNNQKFVGEYNLIAKN